MHPIHLQDGDHGIGVGYPDFVHTFSEICKAHLKEGRANAFAFIFYNVHDGAIRTALKQEGGFRTLNEASGDEVTLFYLHDDAAEELSRAFNRRFLRALGISEQIRPPCIAFFRVYRESVEDISIHSIDERTQEPHMVVEQLRRLVAADIAQRKREGDLSALKVIGDAIPFGKFLRELAAPAR